jgi:hypothetical protein
MKVRIVNKFQFKLESPAPSYKLLQEQLQNNVTKHVTVGKKYFMEGKMRFLG